MTKKENADTPPADEIKSATSALQLLPFDYMQQSSPHPSYAARVSWEG
jgi:hypothetical protein